MIRWGVVVFTASFVALVFQSLALPAHAAEANPREVIAGVRVGFAGRFKVGYWTPIEVRLKNASDKPLRGHVELILPDGDGVPSRVTSPARLELAAGQSQTIQLCAKFGRPRGTLQVRFVAEDGTVLDERTLSAGQGVEPFLLPQALPATDELIVCVGSPLGVESALQATRRRDEAAAHIAQLPDATSLPETWYGYEGVDTLVFTTSEPALYAGLTPASRQGAALDQWIKLGGSLVLCVGGEAAQVLADDTLLGQLAPGRFEKMTPLRRTTALEIYADTTARIDAAGGPFRLDVPRLIDVRGVIEAHEGAQLTDLPLVIRAAEGFGQVALVAVDLDQPPLANWPGRAALVNRLLDRNPPAQNVAREESADGAVSTIGYDDLSGQLRAALEQFDGVRMISFAVVGGLVFVYLLLIGPIDYWIVKKLFGRMEATWITFTLLVVAISAGAYVAAYQLKGRDLRTNQVELVDFDFSTGLARGAVWSNLFSPQAETYDLSLAPRLPGGATPQSEPQVLFSWMGLPGAALGGMQSGSINPPQFRQAYDFSPELNQLTDVPVQIWSTKGFQARWNCQAELPLDAELKATLDNMLDGRLVNRLGVDLVEARLHYDRWVYPIPVFKEGQTVTLGQRLQPLTSRTLLTRQRAIDQKDVATAYSEEITDVARIMEMMTFHKLAGGRQYTAGLMNRYQDFTDLSDHLKLGRAVLIARVAEPGSPLLRDGEPIEGSGQARWTIYRFVIPVAAYRGAAE